MHIVPGGYAYDHPDFLALAAAECEQVTFVVYQKYDNYLYLRGELKSGFFNGSSSPVVPEQRISMGAPAQNTSLSAVCQSTSGNGVVSSILIKSSPLCQSLIA